MKADGYSSGQSRNYSSDSGYSGGGQCSGYSSGNGGYRGGRKESGSHPGDYGRPARSEYSRPWRADYTQSQKQRDDAESPAYQELKAQLAEYYRKGVKVSLGGVRMPVGKIAQICAVREEGKYMGDYIIDEAGELIEVRFDRVSR